MEPKEKKQKIRQATHAGASESSVAVTPVDGVDTRLDKVRGWEAAEQVSWKSEVEYAPHTLVGV
jgi:hypothetical protein